MVCQMSIDRTALAADLMFNSHGEAYRDVQEAKSILLTRWVPKGPFNLGQVYALEQVPDISLYLAVVELLEEKVIKGIHPYDHRVRRHDQMAYEAI